MGNSRRLALPDTKDVFANKVKFILLINGMGPLTGLPASHGFRPSSIPLFSSF